MHNRQNHLRSDFWQWRSTASDTPIALLVLVLVTNGNTLYKSPQWSSDLNAFAPDLFPPDLFPPRPAFPDRPPDRSDSPRSGREPDFRTFSGGDRGFAVADFLDAIDHDSHRIRQLAHQCGKLSPESGGDCAQSRIDRSGNGRHSSDFCGWHCGNAAARRGRGVDFRFYRGDPACMRKVEGVGLGLSLSREIVRARQGDLRLESESGTIEGAISQTGLVLILPRFRKSPAPHTD